MSNVALPSDQDRESPLQTLLGVRHRRQITTIDLIFGTYTVVIAALAALAWLHGAGSPRSIVVFLAFLLANALISEISRRSAHPLRIEIGRAVVGAIIAPATYVLADAPFSHWWPGFMIMCLGGNISLRLLTGSPRLGRVLVLYYVALLTLAEWLGTPSMNWYAFALNAGAVAMVGLLFAEIVSLLGMALASEREQRRQLTLEKARSETLLRQRAEDALRIAEALGRAGEGVVALSSLRRHAVGVILVGSVAARERIERGVAPAIEARITDLGSSVLATRYVPPDEPAIAAAITSLHAAGADMLIIAGETSIMDRDDVTPQGIRMAGGRIEHYGAPVEPGNLLLLGYLDTLPVLGAPGCARSRDTNIVDLLLPRLLAGEPIGNRELAALGHGGLLSREMAYRFPPYRANVARGELE